MDITEVLQAINEGEVGTDESNLLMDALFKGKKARVERSPVKVLEGAKIACKEFEVDGVDGKPAYRKFWYLTSPVEVTPGTKHHIHTRKSMPTIPCRTCGGRPKDRPSCVPCKATGEQANANPWPPSYVQIMKPLGTNDEGGKRVFVYTYERLKADGTKREEK